MKRYPSISRRECISALHKGGFRIVRTSGDHYLLKPASGRGATVSVPDRKDIHRNTLGVILKQAKLTLDEFEKLRGRK